MMLDTGAMHTQIASATARRLRLPDDPHHRSVITDLGGTGKPRPDALVDTLAVGWAITTPGHLPVVDMRQPPIGGHVLAGYLGADFLAQFDLDLDLPNRHLTLWRVAATCRGDFVPWRFAHAVLPAEQHPNGWLLVPAQLGGYRVRALLDTGTNLDFIGSNAAPVVHLEPKLAVSDWTILNRLVVSDVMWTAFRRFREFDFGPNRQVNLSIGIVGGALPAGDMLLGVATLRRQRVWLSYTTRQVFIAQRPVTPPP